MSSRLFIRLGYLLSVPLLFLSLAAAGAADSPKDVPPTADQQRRVREHDRLRDEARELQAEGKLTAAIAAAEKAVAAARAAYGADTDPLADSLAELASLHEDHDDLPAARKARTDVLAIRRQQHGDDHWRSTEARLALTAVDRLARLDAEPRRRLVEARNFSAQIGDCLTQGKLQEGVALAERAAAIRKEILGDKDLSYGQSLNDLAVLDNRLGDFARAEPLFVQAVDIFRHTLGEHHPGYATGLSNQGLYHQALRDYASAEPLLVKALEITKAAVGDKDPLYARSLAALGNLRRDQGNLAAAEPLLRQALAIHEQGLHGKDPDYGVALNNLAVLYQDLGDFARAGDLLDRATKLALPGDGPRTLSAAARLHNLGILCYNMGDFARAAALLREVVDIRKQILGDKHLTYADSLNDLGSVYESQGKTVEASRFYHDAAAVYLEAIKLNKQVLGDRHAQFARLLSNLGSQARYMGILASVALNKPAEAAEFYREALDNYQEAAAVEKHVLGDKHPVFARSLGPVAEVYLLLRDYDKAEATYRKAGEIFRLALGEQHPEYARNRGDLGFLYYLQGDGKRAEPLLQQSLAAAGEQVRLAATGQSERQQLAMLRVARARLDFYLSLAVSEKQSADKAYRHVLTWKGAVFAGQRETRLQRSHPELAGVYRDLRRTSIQLATLGLSAPSPDEAARRTDWERQMASLTERKEQLERDLSRQSAAFRGEQALRRLTPAELQAALPRGVVLVDFLTYTYYRPSDSGAPFTSEERLVAFVVRHDGPLVQLDLGPVQPISEAIGRWRTGCVKDEGFEDPHDAAGTLRKLLWLPLEEHLKGAETVLLSPDGALGSLPFAALPGARKGTFLVEEVALAVVPVPQLLPQVLAPDKAEGGAQPAPGGPPSLLLIGDVNYDAEPGAAPPPGSSASCLAPRGVRGVLRAGRLTGTKVEIEKIAATFRRTQREPLIEELRGDDATESQVRKLAPKHHYLHFATHGFFAPGNLQSGLESASARQVPGKAKAAPAGEELFAREGVGNFHPGLLSGLMLAGANKDLEPDKDDGILTALEVAELDLRQSELAVLSACQTALGTESPGEGLLGLQRAFQVAGTRTVVGSLWSVNDKSTQELMVDFYTNLWDKKMTRLEALRQAQLKMLHSRKWSEPNYWAPFVLSGDWR